MADFFNYTLITYSNRKQNLIVKSTINLTSTLMPF